MSLWRQVIRGFRVLTNRTAADRDVDDEVQHYREQAAADLEASGLSPGDARRVTRLELGDATVVREHVREYGWENVIGTLFSDLRYAARQLRRNPGFAAVSVLTLALGIGASTAIFSAVNPILFKPLPYPHAGRILTVWDISGGSRLAVTFGTYRELVERSHSFETIAVMKPWQPTMTGPGQPERFEGQRVSASYFRVLGMAARMGRDFQASDDRHNGPNVVILSSALWHRRFGGDSTIVGRQVVLDDNLFTVIGVMSSAFEDVTRAVKPALLAVLGAVMLLLTVACVNVTNLLLARGAQRRGEFATRGDLYAGVQQSSQRTIGGHHLTRGALLVAEVALAVVLLVGAGLLLRSLQRWFAIDPGFDASHLLTMQVQTSGRRFDKPTTDRFFAQALDAARRVPGVDAAAFTSQLPLSGDDDEYGARFEGDERNADFGVFRYAVSPGYIETIGIPLRRGRLLDSHDMDGAPPAVLISESLASGKFPGQNPLGRRVHIGPTNGPGYTVVGVVGDVKQVSLAASHPDAVYITTTQSWFVDNALSLVVRARDDAAVLTPAIKNAIWSAGKDQPIVRVATMDDLLAVSAADRRFSLILFEAFALTALVLAAVGIYGVLAGSVTERSREIGVRSALGASPSVILALVFRQGMTLAVLGIVIGLGGAVAASRALVALLFGLSRLDPMTYLGVIALLLGVAGIACWLPAWRAERIDPSTTLRAE